MAKKHRKSSTLSVSERLMSSYSIKKTNWIFVISMGILMLALVLLALAYHVEQRSKQPTSIPQTAFKINEPISMGVVEMKLEQVKFESGQTPFKAPDGKKYAIATLDIKNKSDRPIQVLPSGDMYMKNDAGDVAYISPYSLSQPFRAGELSPGEQINGDLSFLIKNDSTYKLYIDAIWSGGVIPFATE